MEVLIERLSAHLQDVQASPSTPLDQEMLLEAELVLPGNVSRQQSIALIAQASVLLESLQQDPTPLVNLLLRLLEPFSFGDILSFDPPVAFEAGLAVVDYMAPFNRLILTLLEKATYKSSDAAIVATQPATVLALVRLWLCTADTGIASQASSVLLRLLRVDQEVQASVDDHLPIKGQGLVWKRLFGDKDVYETFFAACCLNGASKLELSKSQRTLAQARLLEWLPAVGSLDWSCISRSHHADIESQHSSSGGLLQFAALDMVDRKDDVLMHICLIDFYSALLMAVKESNPASAKTSSVSLEFLVSHGLHARSSAYYLHPRDPSHDPLDARFLYGPSCSYIASYAETYPDHYLASSTASQVNKRLFESLDLTPSRWAHAESPKHDLHMIASLPPTALLPQGSFASSPLSLLPSKATNTDVLNTLGTIFHGPKRVEVIEYPHGSPLMDEKAEQSKAKYGAAARTLYYLYLNNNPRFWADVVSHANTIALKEQALAAIGCIIAVTTANWSSTAEVDVPMATPATGTLAVLTPPSLEYTLPYLLKPAQSFANLVGGRGDTESAAYKVAAAKYDALKALYNMLKQQILDEPDSGFEDILTTVGKRLAEGPLSREGEIGGRIGTLDV